MFRGKSLTKEILFMTAAGPILLSSLFAPNAIQILKPLIKWRKNWDIVDRRRIDDAIKRLNKKRFIELSEINNQLYIEITEKGNKIVKRFDYDNIKLLKPKTWDKKWRLVMFDIPDKKKKERRALSQKLKEIGFYPLQESVFIFPHDCRNEIDFVCAFLAIDRYVNYCTVEFLDKREGDVRRIFNLRLK